MTDLKATIFDIQRSSFHDGPGIRTTVFFKGCNLACAWCHNPESQRFKREFLFYAEKCRACGACRGKTAEDTDFSCLFGAKEICGRSLTTEEVLEIVLKDKLFYDTSNGGVTFSGGECMLQLDFLLEILQKCKENGIHTAVDTAGNVPWDSFERILPTADMFLYDIKAMDDAVHRKYTGVGNSLILENLARLLAAGARLWVRIPVIPDVNDNEEEMKRVRAFFEENGHPEKVELLPYHGLGEAKARALGRDFIPFAAPDAEAVARLKELVPDIE